jgi:hypothetical protein
MLRAELRHISPNAYPDWDAFASSERREPWDDFGWFELNIGLEGREGTDLFQVLAATPAAVSRAKGDDKHRRILVVDSFEPADLARELREYVSSVTAHTWDEIVEQLRRTMYWEYERNYS